MPFLAKQNIKTLPLELVETKNFNAWLKKQPAALKSWVQANDFQAKPYQTLLLSDAKGRITGALCGVETLQTLYALADLPESLPKDSTWHIATPLTEQQATALCLGWALGTYQFDRYKKHTRRNVLLVPHANANMKEVRATYEALFLARDLINTPSCDLGPQELEQAAKQMATKFKASISVIKGQTLLTKNYPAIYAVGKGATAAPRLIDLSWGRKNAPLITLVGKGVCFDTGGLDIKPSNAMSLMKKDMGGAAHVLALAHMIMALKINVRLRVLIPAVENMVDANSFRPGDIIATRKGLSIEIGDTDAEGRLVLADALTEACQEKPKLLIDFATLTGAARVALGPELPPLFCNDDQIANDFLQAGINRQDPLWRLPLWRPYRDGLQSDIADLNNVAPGGMGGAITAALFLEHFIDKDQKWAHIDTYGWNLQPRPGRPEGAAVYGVLAGFDLIRTYAASSKSK